MYDFTSRSPSLLLAVVGFYGNTPLTRRTVNFQGTTNTQLGNTLALLLQALGDTFQGIGLIDSNV